MTSTCVASAKPSATHFNCSWGIPVPPACIRPRSGMIEQISLKRRDERRPSLFLCGSSALPRSGCPTTPVPVPNLKPKGQSPTNFIPDDQMTERNKVGRAGIKMVGPQPNFVTRELAALEAPFQGVLSRDPSPKSSGPIHGMPVVQRLEAVVAYGCTLA